MIINVHGEELYFGYPDDENVPELKDIWTKCYPGDEEFCSFYFENYYENNKCVIMKNSEQIVCVAHFLRGIIVSEEKEIPVIYLYAGGTAGNLRKKGYFRLFNDILTEQWNDSSCAAYIFTANDGLEEMYDNMGFIRTSTLNVTTVMPGENVSDKGAVIKECPFETFVIMRDRYVRKHKNGLIWDESVMRFLYKNFSLNGGVYVIEYQGLSYYAVVTDMPDEIFVRETDALPEHIDAVISALRIRYGNKKVKLYSKPEITYGDYDYKNVYYGHGKMTDKGYSEQFLEDVYINIIEE